MVKTMSKIRSNSIFSEISTYIVMAFIVFAIAGGLVALVYGLLGYFEGATLRAVATAFVFLIVGSFVLGLQIGKATVRGIEKGLDLKLSARERALASARPATSQINQGIVHRANDDLLPSIGQRAIIVERREDNDTPLEI